MGGIPRHGHAVPVVYVQRTLGPETTFDSVARLVFSRGERPDSQSRRLLLWLVILAVLFMVLPWGIRREEAPEEGHEPGAPANPRIVLKLAITTVIACVIWGGVYWAIAADLIHFGPR